MKKLALILALLLVASGAEAAVVFQNLGTSAPPTTLGPYHVGAFDQTPQAAITDFTSVSSIPGNPEGSDLGVSPNLDKRTIGASWGTWSNGYTGVVYYGADVTSMMLTLPTGTAAFYFYAEPNQFSDFNVSATTAQGATSGPISVNGQGGANGFAFYSSPGDPILTITVTCTDASGFAIGEFGAVSVQQAGSEPVPAVSPWGLGILGAALALGGAFLLKKRA